MKDLSVILPNEKGMGHFHAFFSLIYELFKFFHFRFDQIHMGLEGL